MDNERVIERDWGFTVYEGTEPYGFISYKREDSATVAKYAKALSDKGVNLWYDYGIAAGKWEDTISEKLMGAAYLVVFVTRLTFLSEEIKKEVKTAKARGIDVIPVFLENVDTTQIEPKKATFLIELQIMQGVPAFNKWNEQEVADELLRLINTKTASDDTVSFATTQQLESNRALLTGEELSECVAALYDTEQSLLCQKKTMMNLIEKTNTLGQARTVQKPVEPQKQAYPSLEYPKKPQRNFKFKIDDNQSEFANGILMYWVIPVVMFCVFGFILFFLYVDNEDFWAKHINFVENYLNLSGTFDARVTQMALILCVAIYIIYGIILGFICYILNDKINEEKAKKISTIVSIILSVSYLILLIAFFVSRKPSQMFWTVLFIVLGILAIPLSLLIFLPAQYGQYAIFAILSLFVYPILALPFRFVLRNSEYKRELKEYSNKIKIIDQNHNIQIQHIENNYAEAMKQYEYNMSLYHDKLQQEDLRVQSETKQIQAINFTVNQLLAKYSETENALKTLYDNSPINANYRHIIPMGYMNELLKLRVCNRLDSKDGLNYTVRSELSNRQIIAEIDDVINDFDKLVGSKMMMYYDVKQQFEKAKKLSDDTASLIFQKVSHDTPSSEFSAILAASPVGAYITERQTKEKEYLSSPIFQ